MEHIGTGIKKRIARPDLILIGLLLLAGIAGLFAVRYIQGNAGVTVQITVDGELYGTYPFGKEQDIPIMIDGKQGNLCKITGTGVKMACASCPDKRCVHQGIISKPKEAIICLPNKVIVQIEGPGQGGLDSVSR